MTALKWLRDGPATLEGIRDTLVRWKHVVWTGMLGLVIGVIPGAGAAIASFVAYQQSRIFSKTPELYGTGHVEGLIAPESANNGVTSGTLIPLLIIGVPGGATAAIMAVVLEYHGVQFGPDLFESNPLVGYGPFVAMAITYVLLGLLILPLTRYFSNVLVVPTIYIAPIIIAFTLVGSFVPRAYVFDMGVAIVFGIIGYIARKTGYHVAAILIGVILGPLLENFFLRALRISQGDLMTLFSSNIGNVLWVLLIASLFAAPLKRRLAGKMTETLISPNLKHLAGLDIAGGGQIVVQGDFAYVGHMKPPLGTSVIDVSDPENPKVVAELEVGSPWSHTHKVRVCGPRMITNVEQDRRHFLRRGAQIPGIIKQLQEDGISDPDAQQIAQSMGVTVQDISDMRAGLETRI